MPGWVGVPIEMLDASALLWRMYLDGVDTGGRFVPLAESWASKACGEPWYTFDDLHADDGVRRRGPPRRDAARSTTGWTGG